MHTIPAKTIERNRNNPNGRNHVCTPPANQTYAAKKSAALPREAAHESQTLRAVPYRPNDLAGHCDPEASLHVCTKWTANKGFPLGITRARPRGDENV